MRFRAFLAGCALVSGAVPAALGAGVACAAPGSAALVVDLVDSGGVYRYCVDLSGDSVNGIELIQLASEQHGLQYSLGYGGQAVCRLQGVGPSGDDCFGDDPYFWGYWRGQGSGGWGWSSSGAASTRVYPGDVQGWSWGTGQNGDTHPKPPATTYASVCGDSGDKSDEGNSKGSGAPSDPAPQASAPPDTSGSPAPADGKNRAKKDKSERSGRTDGSDTPSPEPSPEPSVPAPVAGGAPSGSGPTDPPTPPIAGFVGLAAVAGIIAASVLTRKGQR